MTDDPEIRPARAQKTIGPPAAIPTLTIDWELYGEYLEEFDLSDAEQRELIEALWSIVVSFVDLGFNIHPAQLATKDCCERNDSLIAGKSASVLDCLHTTKTEFTASAHENVALTPERIPE